MGTSEDISKGLLSVEVKAPTIIAGTGATVSLIIRNPFPEVVIIESIRAPSAAPLLPEQSGDNAKAAQRSGTKPDSFLRTLAAGLGSLRVHEVKMGPLVAEFPESKRAEFAFDMQANSKLDIKTPFPPSSQVHIRAQEGSVVSYDVAEPTPTTTATERVIAPQQEDLASFELKTAHWLLVKPKVLELHALIKYRVGMEQRSQIVPVTISIQPPVKAILIGTLSGSILGYFARTLNNGFDIQTVSWMGLLVSLLGMLVMATILAIVLSRQESSKGFVTLEDFYGAFVVGAMLGYLGTGYFDGILKPSLQTG